MQGSSVVYLVSFRHALVAGKIQQGQNDIPKSLAWNQPQV